MKAPVAFVLATALLAGACGLGPEKSRSFATGFLDLVEAQAYDSCLQLMAIDSGAETATKVALQDLHRVLSAPDYSSLAWGSYAFNSQSGVGTTYRLEALLMADTVVAGRVYFLMRQPPEAPLLIEQLEWEQTEVQPVAPAPLQEGEIPA